VTLAGLDAQRALTVMLSGPVLAATVTGRPADTRSASFLSATTPSPSPSRARSRARQRRGSAWDELGTSHAALKYGGVALAATPEGDPVLAYAATDGSAVVERWSSSTLTWTATPSLGITGATEVEVSVDSAGAIYVAIPKVNQDGYTVDVDAVWRLAPGAQAWSSLDLPSGFTTASSRMTLLGLPGTGGGVAAAWIKGGPRIARYTGGAWETVYAPSTTQYFQIRPMLAATSADDLWFAYVSNAYVPSMIIWRLQKY